MKLRHLLLASFAACAFASCSDDSSNGIEIPEENYQMIDANVSLTATALDGIRTKAIGDINASANEQFINELTAYLFYVDNGGNEDAYKFAAMKTVSATDNESVSTIEDIVVKVKATQAGELSDTKLAVVFFANTKLTTTPATLGEVIRATIAGDLVSFSDVHSTGTTKKYVPMFSQKIEIGGSGSGKQLLAGTSYDNWVSTVASPSIVYTKNAGIGEAHTKVTSSAGGAWTEGTGTYDPQNTPNTDKIPLTRHVARVQLEGLDCNFTQSYEHATFTLTDVYVANVSTKSKLYGSSSDYSLEVAGTDPAPSFSHGCGYVRDDYFLVSGSQNVAQFAKSYGNSSSIVISMSTNAHENNVSDGNINYSGSAWKKFKDVTQTSSTLVDEMAQFYVYEYDGTSHDMTADANTEDTPTGKIQTMLILKGKWTNNGVVKENRYYRIPIGNGTAIGVQRNNIYKVYATITGEGSKDPDTSELNACVSFSVKVEPWTVITQHENDVN
ncbi:fimbrial protein [Parabacteroides sp.]